MAHRSESSCFQAMVQPLCCLGRGNKPNRCCLGVITALFGGATTPSCGPVSLGGWRCSVSLTPKIPIGSRESTQGGVPVDFPCLKMVPTQVWGPRTSAHPSFHTPCGVQGPAAEERWHRCFRVLSWPLSHSSTARQLLSPLRQHPPQPRGRRPARSPTVLYRAGRGRCADDI